eukprot:NODE_71_length_24927_cov_1.205937.p1 type:complete len:854 gc:universal NODE_71_length_24927_cov_1.205937:10144-12705(+)
MVAPFAQINFNRFAIYCNYSLMTNWSALQLHCQTLIKDFSESGYEKHLLGGNITASNLTVSQQDGCLKAKDAKQSDFWTSFDTCQSHRYLWVHLDVDVDASFKVKTKDCQDVEQTHEVSCSNGTWSTPSGTYYDGFLIKVTGIKKFHLEESSVDEWKLKKLSFVDCPMPGDSDYKHPENYTIGVQNGTGNVNWTMAKNHTANGTINWDMAKHHNGTAQVNWDMAKHHNATANLKWEMAKNWTGDGKVDWKLASTHNGTAIYNEGLKTKDPVTYPPQNAPASNGWVSPPSSPEPVKAAVPTPIVDPKPWTRENIYGNCFALPIHDFNKSLSDVEFSNYSARVLGSKGEIKYATGTNELPFDLQWYDMLLIEFTATAGTAFTVELEQNNKWHKSPYSRIVIPDNRHRSVLLDLSEFKWENKWTTGIKFSSFTGELKIDFTKISFLNCNHVDKVETPALPVCTAQKIVLNDFFTGEKNRNRRGLRMGCDGTAEYITLNNGSLELKPYQNSTNQTYWYTNIGTPCFNQSLSEFKRPSLEIEVKAPAGSLYDIQLEFADKCWSEKGDYSRQNYTVKQVPSAAYAQHVNDSVQALRIPLESSEFLNLFSLYLMNIHSTGSLVLNHIHIVDVACRYEVIAPTPTPTTTTKNIAAPAPLPATNYTIPAPLPSNGSVENYTVPPSPPSEHKVKKYYALNNFTSNDPQKNIRGFKMGCDGTANYSQVANGTFELNSYDPKDNTTANTYWYTNVGAPCFAQNFTDYKKPAIEIQAFAVANTTFEIQLQFADSCNHTERDHYKVKQFHSKDLAQWTSDCDKYVHIPVDHDDFHNLFSIYLLNIDSKNSIKLDHIHVVDLDDDATQ